jgi:hypothetical protein
VQTGDTLDSLAGRTNTSVYELQQVNCLQSFTIQPGQTIYLPFNPPTPTVTSISTSTPLPGPTSTRTPTPIAPIIISVNARQTTGATVDITVVVKGENFKPEQAGFEVKLVGPTTIPLELEGDGSSTGFTATASGVTLPANLPVGAYDLTVINPDGRLDVEPRVFPQGPLPGPTITDLIPRCGDPATNITLNVTGNNFVPGPGFTAKLRFPSEPDVILNVNIATATSVGFEATIVAPTLMPGRKYTLIVTNPDNQFGVKSDAFQTISPLPAVCP